MANTFHYTDRRGYNSIHSQRDWTFRAHQPPTPSQPHGAYFTSLAPTTARLAARLRIPRTKLAWGFWFTGRDGLVPLNQGRGRGAFIFYSPEDYIVTYESGRQQAAGTVEFLRERIGL